jgi:hypothetical protein
VRLKLHLQGAEVRAGKLPLKFERTHGIALRHQLRVECGVGKPDERVKERLGTEAGKTKEVETAISLQLWIRSDSANPMSRYLEQRQMKKHEDDGDAQMRAQTAPRKP